MAMRYYRRLENGDYYDWGTPQDNPWSWKELFMIVASVLIFTSALTLLIAIVNMVVK